MSLLGPVPFPFKGERYRSELRGRERGPVAHGKAFLAFQERITSSSASSLLCEELGYFMIFRLIGFATLLTKFFPWTTMSRGMLARSARSMVSSFSTEFSKIFR